MKPLLRCPSSIIALGRTLPSYAQGHRSRALVDDGKGGQVPLIIRDLAELDPEKRVRYYLDALKILAPKDINVLNSATPQTIEQRLIELSGIVEDADYDDAENEAENEEI